MADERPTNFFHDGGKSSQEAYYDWQLRKEKMTAIAAAGVTKGWLREDEQAALKEVGEKEKLEIKILARLYGLADSSAELLQVMSLSGCKKREECAKELAETYYRKITTEQVLNRFVAPENAKTQIIGAAQTTSRNNYNTWGTNL